MYVFFYKQYAEIVFCYKYAVALREGSDKLHLYLAEAGLKTAHCTFTVGGKTPL